MGVQGAHSRTLFSEKSSGVTSGEMACCEPTERLAALMPALIATSKLIPRVRQDITPPAKLRGGRERDGREMGKIGKGKRERVGRKEREGRGREGSNRWKGGTKGRDGLFTDSKPSPNCVCPHTHTTTPKPGQSQ